MVQQSEWAQSDVETLKILWANGLSGSQIARKLGGFTKNAVISKANRIGLTPRGPDVNRQWREQGRSNPTIILEGFRRIKQITDNVVAKDVGHLDSEPKAIGPIGEFPAHRECRWIHGDPRQSGWQCCGHPVQNGSPYCIHHHARARVKSLTKIRPR